jgi:hypothetical protein
MNSEKMRIVYLGLLTLVGSLITQSCLAATYYNSRFEYSVDYPSSLKPQPEADNGDGRQFTVAGSSAYIAVFASYSPSVFDKTDKGYLKEIRAEVHRQSVAYESFKGNRYVYSYVTPKKTIIYGWVVAQKGTEYQLRFEYPEKDKSTFDPIIKQMTQSFKIY